MKNRILNLIEKENPKAPYKDEELAGLLCTTRYEVVRLRKKNGILDWRKRRLPLLLSEMKKILSEQENVTTTNLTNQLVAAGFGVSRFLIGELRDGIQNTDSESGGVLVTGLMETVPQRKSKLGRFEMVGQDGSLEKQIKQMKAAMLYPPKGLHTLVVGETGTGKSLLVGLIFKQLQENGLIDSKRKMVKYNCADYANNPQLLAAHLFGYVKGAFTGADEDKEGLIREADGGILFLDEIHRLSSEGQEMLFNVIDDGKYRRVGQSYNSEEIQVMIIGATTENVDSSLLDTFKRRIPMIIELPPLRKRTLDEKFQLITRQLQKEADAIDRTIILKAEFLTNLLTYSCKGNVGQLESDIKVAVANGYLRTMEVASKEINLQIVDFGEPVKEGFTKELTGEEIDFYREHGIVIRPQADEVEYIDEKNIYMMSGEIFETIRDRYDFFQEQKLPKRLIDDLLYREIEYRLTKMLKTIKSGNKKLLEIYNIATISENVAAKKMISLIEEKVHGMDADMKRCLLVTIDDVMKKVIEGWNFVDVEMTKVSGTHLLEYRIAQEITDEMENQFGYQFPAELPGVIALYLKSNAEEMAQTRTVRVLIITHGDIGREIARVANNFAGEEILDWLSLPLNLKKEEYTDHVLEKIAAIEEDNLLLLVDMGSPLVLGEIIAKRTDKNTKTVSRVDLAIALEAAVKLKRPNVTLTEIYDYIKSKSDISQRQNVGKAARNGENIIVVSCITGQGAAVGIKTYIEENYPFVSARGIKVLPVGVMNTDIDEYLKEIKRDNNIIACIGAIPIEMEGVPFVGIEEIMGSDGFDILDNIVQSTLPVHHEGKLDVVDYFFEDAIFEDFDCKDKLEAISIVADRLCVMGYVSEGYKEDVLKREKAISTEYKFGTSIPHTYAKHVIKSVIAVVRFTDPILWASDYLCDTMFMIALKEEDTKAIKGLSKLINNEMLLEQIKEDPVNTIKKLANDGR